MKEIEFGSVVTIPREYLTDPEVLAIYKDLTLVSPFSNKYGFGAGESLRLYEENPSFVRVPRRYFTDKLSRLGLAGAKIKDVRSSGRDVAFDWVGDVELRRGGAAEGFSDWGDRQIAWTETLYQNVGIFPNGAIGQAPTSFGKTVCAMRLIWRIGKTALVVVHKDFQLRQWADAAKKWLNLPEERIGIVQGKRLEYEGKDLVVAMVETLTSRELPEEFKRWPGLVFVDEVHRFGARTWSKAVPLFPALYRAGVSATPKRRDGFDKAFLWTIGPSVVQEKEWYLNPVVNQIAWPTFIEPRRYCELEEKPSGETEVSKVFLGKLITILSELPKYNSWLAELIEKAAVKGRRILVMSERRFQLEELRRMFDARTASRYKTAFYWGGQKKAEQADSETAEILFGTFGKAKEALNIKGLDTLFLVTPRADVEQDVGRILRIDPKKKTPLVVDVVHVGIKEAEAFAKKRRTLYRTKGFEVKRLGNWSLTAGKA